jgi:hypothetical protein
VPLETTAYVDYSADSNMVQPKWQFDCVSISAQVTRRPNIKLPANSHFVQGSFDRHTSSITTALSVSPNDLKLLLGVERRGLHIRSSRRGSIHHEPFNDSCQGCRSHRRNFKAAKKRFTCRFGPADKLTHEGLVSAC